MKTNKKNIFPYTNFSTYCTRTPFLPINYYLSLVENDIISDFDLIKHFQTPEISEAIYLASPDLFFQLVKWSNNEVLEKKKSKRLRITLLKYLIRMSTRCTPFGLFAAIGTGKFDSKTNILLKVKNTYHKNSHFDMDFLASYANELSNTSNIKRQLNFYPNTSIYKIGNRYRYVEYSYQDKRRVFSLESITQTMYLEIILIHSAKGSTIGNLVSKLIEKGIEFITAQDFVYELISNQILVSELEPTITGPDFLENLRIRLSRLSNVAVEIKTIEKLQLLLKNLDQNLGNSSDNYTAITNLISKLRISYEQKSLIQTDTYSEYEKNTISYGTLRKIKRGIAFLNKISRPEKNINLERFKEDFIKRYEYEKMPLLKVMDVESGIGYIQNPNSLEATPFLDDIISPEYFKEEELNSFIIPQYQKQLFKKLFRIQSENKIVMELTDDDFPIESYDWSNAPDTLSVLTEIVQENGVEKIIMNYCNNHAAKLLGRFAIGNESIKHLINEIVEKESQMNPNCMMAEIIHIPESRTGNILRRPLLREFEIPYLGKSNLPLNQQIHLENILVTVENNSIKLYNKSNNQPIIVRSSNAHNFGSNSLPIYHFLCDLQSQEQKGFGFSWGPVLSHFNFLPRIFYKDCILSLAKWMFDKDETEDLFKSLDNQTNLFTTVSSWRKKYKIPCHAQIVDGDNTLPINFENLNSIEMFIEIIKNKEKFILEEFLYKEDSIIKCSSEEYCNQFVFTFYNRIKIQDVQKN